MKLFCVLELENYISPVPTYCAAVGLTTFLAKNLSHLLLTYSCLGTFAAIKVWLRLLAFELRARTRQTNGQTDGRTIKTSCASY